MSTETTPHPPPEPGHGQPRQPRMREELVEAMEEARLTAAAHGRYVSLREISQHVAGQGRSETTVKRVRDMTIRSPIEAIVDAYAAALGIHPRTIYTAALQAWATDEAGDTFQGRRLMTSQRIAALEKEVHTGALTDGRVRAAKARRTARSSNRTQAKK